MVKWCLQQ